MMRVCSTPTLKGCMYLIAQESKVSDINLKAHFLEPAQLMDNDP